MMSITRVPRDVKQVKEFIYALIFLFVPLSSIRLFHHYSLSTEHISNTVLYTGESGSREKMHFLP